MVLRTAIMYMEIILIRIDCIMHQKFYFSMLLYSNRFLFMPATQLEQNMPPPECYILTIYVHHARLQQLILRLIKDFSPMAFGLIGKMQILFIFPTRCITKKKTFKQQHFFFGGGPSHSSDNFDNIIYIPVGHFCDNIINQML